MTTDTTTTTATKTIEVTLQKGKLPTMYPEDIIVVGIDEGGPGDRDYDARILLPVNPDLTANILRFGVIKASLVRKDGDKYYCVDGRRRIIHARLANKQLEAAQAPRIKIPVDIRRGDEVTMYMLARSANAFAVADTDLPPVENAKFVQYMIDHGASIPDVCIAMGVKPVTINDWLKLLSLAPDLAAKVDSGEMTVNAGLELTDLSMSEQMKTMEVAKELASGGPVKTSHVAAAAKQAKNDKAGKAGTAQVKKTPKERVTELTSALLVLATQVAKSGVGSKDPKAAQDAAVAQLDLLPFLRKLAKLTTDRTWDQLVKASVPKPDDEEIAA